MATTLKTLVLKTVTAGSVKLTAPADRIGQGLAVDVAYPAEVLSQGQFPLPHNPGSEPNPGSRTELSAPQLREQMRVVAPTVAPAGPAGCPAPGSSAHRRPSSFTHHLSARWHRVAAKRPAAAGRTTTATGIPAAATVVTTDAVQSRASFPAALFGVDRFGSDCQSPDRRDDRWPATWETTPTAAAGK
ncbi:MAG: hypothetical protein JWO38_808 [Gemmataceae bacterium]|nr:hypothetical protein [Gemmataceae bacterium]